MKGLLFPNCCSTRRISVSSRWDFRKPLFTSLNIFLPKFSLSSTRIFYSPEAPPVFPTLKKESKKMWEWCHRPNVTSGFHWPPSISNQFECSPILSQLIHFQFQNSIRPVSDAWQGGCLLAKDPHFASKVVTRKEYEEHGFSLCQERFDIWMNRINVICNQLQSLSFMCHQLIQLYVRLFPGPAFHFSFDDQLCSLC